jgi:hypothetical protein
MLDWGLWESGSHKPLFSRILFFDLAGLKSGLSETPEEESGIFPHVPASFFALQYSRIQEVVPIRHVHGNNLA